MDISGELSGIRTSQLRELDELLKLKTDRSELINLVLAEGLARLTHTWNREIAVYINRSGSVAGAAVGRHASVVLPKLKGRATARQLRCIHTHPNGSSKLSDVDFSALRALELECMAAIGTLNGQILGFEVAFQFESTVEVIRLNAEELPTFNPLRISFTKPFLPNRKERPGEEEKAFLLGLENNPELGR